MEFKADPKGNFGTLIFKGDLSIQDASDLKTFLADSLEMTDDCKLDLSGITSIDLACMQLLYSAWKTALEGGKSFSLEGECSSAFRQTAEDSGYADHKWLCFGS